MADPRFFTNRGPFSLGELARRVGATVEPASAAERLARDVAPLERAGPDDISFFDNVKYMAAFAATGAGACIVAAKHAARAPKGMALLLSPKPYHAYARVAQAFYPAVAPPAGVHPRAVVDKDARLGAGVAVAAGAVIEAGAEIGAGTIVGANSVISSRVRVGAECRIGALVSLSHCEIGDRVTLHPGVCIGQDGFGFAPDPRGHVKVPQLGRVLVGDDCEIGANSTIDRGAGPDTVIGPGCWIDNLVQIGHNVTLGRGCILVAQAGVSGSTRLGDFVAMGGQAGLAGHLTIGAGAQVAAQSGVMNDIPPGEVWFGTPANPIKQQFRQIATLRRLAGRKEDAE
jgi:UDP-3-O-[3-hydroxymyristoyl] glucosamine N-acyltransferase